MKKFGFLKQERLVQKSEYQLAFRKGEKLVQQGFYVYAIPNKLCCNRVGIRVGKKFGKAYVRNRAKRSIREAYRRNKDIINGFDLVFVPRYGKKLNYLEWEESVKKVFLKIKREEKKTNKQNEEIFHKDN